MFYTSIVLFFGFLVFTISDFGGTKALGGLVSITLLFAMTDPDKNVVREARDALRFISRRLDGFGLKDNFTEEERNKVVQAWRNWYLQVRPEAELEE